VTSQPPCIIARLHGTLNIFSTTTLRERLHSTLRPGVMLLIIDLSGVSSCDTGGLAVLVGTQRRARARGIAVCLAAPGHQVVELLRSSGLDRSFTICATLADAVPQRWGGGDRVVLAEALDSVPVARNSVA
jgi:anti-sigma B factor antagonist